jgi:hypothetical protein
MCNFLWDFTYSVSDFLSAVDVSLLFISCVVEHVYLMLEIFFMFVILKFLLPVCGLSRFVQIQVL